MFEIRQYLTPAGKDPYSAWRRKVRDTKAKIAIDKRIVRMELGNFGDCKFCRDGVYEMRINVGPGFRVYYAVSGNQLILLLCAGDKKTQSQDIDKACQYWSDWKSRNPDER